MTATVWCGWSPAVSAVTLAPYLYRPSIDATLLGSAYCYDFHIERKKAPTIISTWPGDTTHASLEASLLTWWGMRHYVKHGPMTRLTLIAVRPDGSSSTLYDRTNDETTQP